MCSRTQRPARRTGLTLLELMLAMALSGLILYAIGMAVDLHLRTLQQRREIIEQSRVARSIMRLISSDLKRVITKYEQDMTALEALGAGSAAEALSSLGLGGEGEAGELGGESSGGGSGGESSGGGLAGSGESAGGETGEEAGSEGAMAGEEESSAYTQDIASATELPPNPGLYGNQNQLQLDISRLPRFDEFYQETPTNSGELVDVVSDVKTVAYYVQTPETAGVYGAKDVFEDENVTSGLVRRQLDRTVTQFAMANGNATSLQQKAEIIAPEIMAIQFRYFDGLEWLLEWDSDYKGGLPMAVEIVMQVRPVSQLNVSRGSAADEELWEERDVYTYRSIVRIPTAKATFGNEEEESEDLEALGL